MLRAPMITYSQVLAIAEALAEAHPQKSSRTHKYLQADGTPLDLVGHILVEAGVPPFVILQHNGTWFPKFAALVWDGRLPYHALCFLNVLQKAEDWNGKIWAQALKLAKAYMEKHASDIQLNARIFDQKD